VSRAGVTTAGSRTTGSETAWSQTAGKPDGTPPPVKRRAPVLAAGLLAGPAILVGIAVGVLLCGVATAATGPVIFVAMAAPQLARRISRSPGVTLVTSALTGATLLVCADLAAQRLFAPVQLPVGIMTAAIGGVYLVFLLRRERR
jgi:iron complex transport system permease protein